MEKVADARPPQTSGHRPFTPTGGQLNESNRPRTDGPLLINTAFMEDMFSGVARRYDLANRVLSLGRDPFWRRALARRIKIIDRPGRLLDLAAGTGDQIVAAKHVHPSLEVTGLDLSAGMMELAGPKFRRLAPPRPKMLLGDALNPPLADNSFDSVSISFGLRNIPAREALYAQVMRLLKPGGRFLVLEMYHDPQYSLAPLIRFYLRHMVPWLGGRLISREQAAYSYLTSSVLAFPRPELLAGELAGAGFISIGHLSYTFRTVMLVWGEKPGPGGETP